MSIGKFDPVIAIILISNNAFLHGELHLHLLDHLLHLLELHLLFVEDAILLRVGWWPRAHGSHHRGFGLVAKSTCSVLFVVQVVRHFLKILHVRAKGKVFMSMNGELT